MTPILSPLSCGDAYQYWLSPYYDTYDTIFNKKIYLSNIPTLSGKTSQIPPIYLSQRSLNFYCHCCHIVRNPVDTAFEYDTSCHTMTPYFHRSIN